jgi:tetratricopeptide (TPR) repeat protein
MDVERLFAAAVARHQQGALDDAVTAYRQVLAFSPQADAAWINLGLAYQAMSRWPDAVAAMQRSTSLSPSSAAAWAGLGGALQAAGQTAAAVSAFLRALDLDPFAVDPCNNLGSALAGQGRLLDARAVLERALRLAPDQPQPYNNLAAVLIDLGCSRDGLSLCRHALMLAPDTPEPLNNQGNALMELGDACAAADSFRKALRLDPGSKAALLNLSGALIDDGALASAVELCRRAIVLRPDDADAYNNLGNALRAAGLLADADRVFRRALHLDPRDADIWYNASSVFLKEGQFSQGCGAFEWRKRTARSAFRLAPLPGPEWHGQPLDGRTLLLFAEQGLGDVLQFIRYAPLVAETAGGPVILRVYPTLVRLCRTLPALAAVVSTDDPLPAYDCHLPLMSLPWRLGTTLNDLPSRVPYLKPDPAAVAAWRERLADCPGHKVGLVWAGDPRPHQKGAHLMDKRRSLSLAQCEDLLKTPGITWVSLQKGAPASQIGSLPQELTLFDPMAEIADFADTAALVSALDLIVSVDTSVAHLAGALAQPVWMLSRFDGCWRWLDGREDSPWYPTMRLYRQAAWGDWGPVLERLATDLRSWISGEKPI